MKKNSKTIIGTIAAVMATTLLVGGLSAVSKGFTDWNFSEITSTLESNENQGFSEFPFEENEIIMSADINEIEMETKIAVNKYTQTYELSYYNAESKQTEQHPTSNGIWEMQIRIEDKIYKRSFQHVISDVSNLNEHFNSITDTWGNESSVVCESSKIYKTEYFYSCSINVDNFNSGCLLSKYYYNSGRFDVYAQCNIYDYGCFAFWLTGVENDKNNPNHELTMEIYKMNQMTFSSSSSAEDYKSNTMTSDVDFKQLILQMKIRQIF